MSIVDIGLPSFVIDLSGSLTSFGIIIGIFSVTQSIFQFPFASISDKFGRRKIVIIGMGIYVIGTFLCFFAQNIIQLIVYRAIQGVGAYTSILQAIIGDIYNKEQHGKGMGYYSLSMNVGYFIGIVLGGLIPGIFGFRSIFLISGILTSITTFLIFIKFKDNAQIEETGNCFNPNKIKNLDFRLDNIKTLLKTHQYNIAVLLNSVRWFLFGSIVAYLIWVLQIQFKFNEIETSYILIIIVALYVGFVFISGRVLDKQGPRKLMYIGQSIVIGFGLVFFVEQMALNVYIFLIATTFIGIGIALFDPAGNALLLKVIEDIDPKLKGSGIGFNNALGFFVSALAPIIICFLGDMNVFYPFYLILLLMAISLIITLKYVGKQY